MNAEELTEIIEEAGYETRKYSGRNMYGRECVGFEVEHGEQFKAIADIMYTYTEIHLNTDDEFLNELSKLAETLGRVKLDEMGRDNYILYFPQIKYAEEK